MMFKVLLALAVVCASCIQASDAKYNLCPCKWRHILNGCYLFVNNKVTWDEARTDCLHKGGDLVIPTSTFRCDYLSKIARRAGLNIPWIGLFRRFDGKFYNTCGTRLSMTNWAPTQPDHHGGKENCGHMYVSLKHRYKIGKWNDIQCNERYGYICQYKSPRCA